ncbi:MAG: response regulator transcription factor [Bryobacterales bacterium]|nr:response regulator transcription factor [Bryobacterales bacterium]
MIRILVVDDHFLVRMGLKATLASEPDMVVVAEAGNAGAALEAAQNFEVDVALIDLRLPGEDGVELTKQLRRLRPQTRVVLISTWGGDEDIFRALQAGSCGYVLKSLPREDLLRAIRLTHQGKRCLPAPVAERLSARLPGSELTPRETDVLRGIVKGLSNREIGAELSISEGTVKLHVNSLLPKLGVSDRTKAALMALHRGLVHLD